MVFVMAHENDPLIPVGMQVRRKAHLSLSVTVPMLRGLLAWLDRHNYSYSVFLEGEIKND